MEVYISKEELIDHITKLYDLCFVNNQHVTLLDIINAINSCREHTRVEQNYQKPERNVKPFTVDEVLDSLREVGINPDEPDTYLDDEDYRYRWLLNSDYLRLNR